MGQGDQYRDAKTNAMDIGLTLNPPMTWERAVQTGDLATVIDDLAAFLMPQGGGSPCARRGQVYVTDRNHAAARAASANDGIDPCLQPLEDAAGERFDCPELPQGCLPERLGSDIVQPGLRPAVD